MLTVHPICPEDLFEIIPQNEQADWLAGIQMPESACGQIRMWPGRTVRDENGAIVLCCGVIPLHAQRAHAWAVLAENASSHLLLIVKLLRAFIEAHGARRTELTIRSDFAPGHKWARLIGFSCEGRMRAYSANGEDHHLYARILEGNE